MDGSKSGESQKGEFEHGRGQYVRVIADKEGDGSAIDWYGKVIQFHDTAYGITNGGRE